MTFWLLTQRKNNKRTLLNKSRHTSYPACLSSSLGEAHGGAGRHDIHSQPEPVAGGAAAEGKRLSMASITSTPMSTSPPSIMGSPCCSTSSLVTGETSIEGGMHTTCTSMHLGLTQQRQKQQQQQQQQQQPQPRRQQPRPFSLASRPLVSCMVATAQGVNATQAGRPMSAAAWSSTLQQLYLESPV